MRGLVIGECVIIIIESRSAIVSSCVSYWAGKQYMVSEVVEKVWLFK